MNRWQWKIRASEICYQYFSAKRKFEEFFGTLTLDARITRRKFSVKINHEQEEIWRDML